MKYLPGSEREHFVPIVLTTSKTADCRFPGLPEAEPGCWAKEIPPAGRAVTFVRFHWPGPWWSGNERWATRESIRRNLPRVWPTQMGEKTRGVSRSR